MKTKLLMFSFLLAAGTLNAATLGYSTFIGGTLWDEGNSIALNEAGNAFVCGEAYSTEFPTTSGAFDVSQNGDYDAFVLKLNPSGTSLVYSTFLGGSQSDKAFSVYVNDSGNAFVSGMSRDGFPTTLGAYDTVQNYGDGFITKLNSTGNALLFSTVIGGTWMDFYSYEINCLDLDGSQNVYLTGATISGDYPVTAGAFTTSNGSAVLTKLNSTGASLGYSSYFGGVGIYDEPWSVAVSTGGNAFISGYTNSSDFPVTSGVFQTSFNGGSSSIFVTKFNTSGSALDYSTYFGGAGSEEGKSIAINSDGNALITGTFHSTGFPTTAGAYDTSFSGWVDAFVTKFSSNATSLIFSTIIGGSSYDWLYNIALDNENNIFVAGGTNYDGGINYPTTSGAYATLSDDQDCIFSKLNSNGSSLLYSTCFGGSNGSDLSYSIDVNSSGKLVFTGITPATTFPVTLNAFDTSFNSTGGTNDVFVTMFEFLPSPPTFTNGNPALPGTGANNGSGGTDFTGNGGTLGSIATQGGTTAMSLLNVNGTNYISYYDLDCNGQTNVEVCFNVNSDWLTGFVGDPSTELRIGHNGSFLSGNTITSLGNGNYRVCGTAPSCSPFFVQDQDDTPLAITLSHFSLKSTKNSIQLNWTTESETNNLGFKIMRSVNNLANFNVVASYENNPNLKGQGNSATPTSYTWNDTEVEPGKTYFYYLADVDFDLFETHNTDRTLEGKIVLEEEQKINYVYELRQNFPNPFNPNTTISYSLAKKNDVKLQIFNIKGELVRTLVSENQNEGTHTSNWNGKDGRGNSVSSGVYFYKLTAGNYTKTNKMILLK